MNIADADRGKLPTLLDELARAVEDLLLTGLTTASEATRTTLHIAFQEASRMKLLRLGATLRLANEELGRFTRNEAEFSRKRLLFFLNRTWLLATGLARALRAGDEATVDHLLRTPAMTQLERLEVVTLGVSKKVAAGSHVAFEFRLRSVTAAGKIAEGQRLAWSCLFPLKAGQDIPAEGFLHLPQKQKFNASVFLEGKTVALTNVGVSLDGFTGRITLTEQSTVATASKFSDWDRFQTWDRAAALRRIEEHRPGPFDVDVEIQEEAVLTDWRMEDPRDGSDGVRVFPVSSEGLTMEAVVSRGVEGKALTRAMEDLCKKKQRPPLFGLLHYEKCRLVLQPLAVFGGKGPEHLMLSSEKIDRAALLKTLKF